MAVADQSTFIKIDRNILQWRWMTNSETFHLFVFLILKANIEDHGFQNITVHRGELVTSLPHLARDTGLTIRKVRTALNHLKSTGEVTDTKIHRGRLIHIVNYNLYQARPTGKATGNRQTSDRQTTGNRQQSKNDKKGKNGKNEKNIYSRPPTVAEVEEYARSEGLTINAMDFVDYNESRGWSGIQDWRPLVRIRARQTAGDDPEDDQLDSWGNPVRKGFETI